MAERVAVTPEMTEHARTQSPLAAQILGLDAGERYYRCPVGGHYKLDLKEFGANCHSCNLTPRTAGHLPWWDRTNQGSAIDMLLAWGKRCGIWDHDPATWDDSVDGEKRRRAAFVDAVLLLNGHVAQHAHVQPPEKPVSDVVQRPRSTIDPGLWWAIIRAGRLERHGLSQQAAADFYHRRWHIAPEAVRGLGFVSIVDEGEFKQFLADGQLTASGRTETLTWQRAKNAGLITENDNLLFNRRYPHLEPMVHPKWPFGNGKEAPAVTSAQFRASERTEELYRKHKRGELDDYVPKFMSCRGTPSEAQVGFGMNEVLRDYARVLIIVEGAKDTAAGRTILPPPTGLVFVGIAGTNGDLPQEVVDRFADRPVVIMLDGDDAGQAGAEMLAENLTSRGMGHIGIYTPAHGDITDGLVARVNAGKPAAMSKEESAAFAARVRRYIPATAEPGHAAAA